MGPCCAAAVIAAATTTLGPTSHSTVGDLPESAACPALLVGRLGRSVTLGLASPALLAGSTRWHTCPPPLPAPARDWPKGSVLGGWGLVRLAFLSGPLQVTSTSSESGTSLLSGFWGTRELPPPPGLQPSGGQAGGQAGAETGKPEPWATRSRLLILESTCHWKLSPPARNQRPGSPSSAMGP